MRSLAIIAASVVLVAASPARPIHVSSPRYDTTRERLYVGTGGFGFGSPEIVVYNTKSRFQHPIATFENKLVGGSAGLAVDAAGVLYVADGAGILEYSGEKGHLSFQIPLTYGAEGVAVGANGVVYATSRSGYFYEFEPQAKSPFVSIGGLTSPESVAVDGNFNAYVIEFLSNYTATLLEVPAGSMTPHVVSLKGVVDPIGVGFSPEGDMYVSDDAIERILAFHPGETKPFFVISPFTGLGGPKFDASGTMFVGEGPGIAFYRPGKRKPYNYAINGLIYGAGATAVFPPVTAGGGARPSTIGS